MFSYITVSTCGILFLSFWYLNDSFGLVSFSRRRFYHHHKQQQQLRQQQPLYAASSYSASKSIVLSLEDVNRQLDGWKREAERTRLNSTAIIHHIVDDIEEGTEEKAEGYLKKRWFGSSNKAYEACKRGIVRINGTKIYSTRRLHLGDIIDIDVSTTESPKTEDEIKIQEDLLKKGRKRLLNFGNSLLEVARNPPVHVIYEDNHFAVVFKPAGVHSLKWLGTMKKGFFSLDDVLPLILKPPIMESSGQNLIHDEILEKPIPCHRLDARVSGCLVVAKTQLALAHLNSQFKCRTVQKEYRAILAGSIDAALLDSTNSMDITEPVDGRQSKTRLTLLENVPCNVYGSLSRVALYPSTGRRHQLRQHCASLGCPIVGDDLYHSSAYERMDKTVMGSANYDKREDEDEDDDEDGDEEDDEKDDDEAIVGDDLDASSGTNPIIPPKVRKGIGLFLMAVAVEFDDPYAPPPGERVRVRIEELDKFRRILKKANAGAAWTREKMQCE